MRQVSLSWLIVLLAGMIAAISGAEIVLVYPRTPDSGGDFRYPEGLDSTFVFGRVVPPRGELFINGIRTPFDDHGAFLTFLRIESDGGKGEWHLVLREAQKEIARTVFHYGFQGRSEPERIDDDAKDHPAFVAVAQANARCLTAQGGTYFLFPQVGCRLSVIGRAGRYYRFELAGGTTGLIDTGLVGSTADSAILPILIGNGAVREHAGISELHLAAQEPVPWTVTQSEDLRELKVQLYGAHAAIERIRYEESICFIRDVRWEHNSAGTLLRVQCREVIASWDITHAADSLRVTVGHSARGHSRSLKGKVIVVDAGHGGSSTGAIGPLGTQEKDVTLEWAKTLARELSRSGADVRLTRTDDRDLDLYERIEFGRRVHADFFISLHCNALPDGEDPAGRSGTGTYYYQPGSQQAAAIIHRHALHATGLKDDGLFFANLAVARPTAFPAVLIEAAYIMHPAEERMLQSKTFLRRLSRAIVSGMKEYFSR